jgi:glycerophosphoryl diester phosphodiesterase
MKFISLSILLILFLLSCKMDKKKEVLFKGSYLILGHKGAGPSTLFESSNIPENSIEAILHSFSNIDGAEVDIQVSADGTFWLYHDHEIKNLKNENINFSEISDNELDQLYYSNIILSRLSQLFFNQSFNKFKNKHLCLDLKFLDNPKCDNKINLCEKLKKNLLNHKKNYPSLNIHLEIYNERFLYIFKHKSIKTYYVYNGNKITQQAYSFNHLNANHFLAKGRFDKSVWVLNQPEEFIKVQNYNPTIVQTDYPNLGKLIKEHRNQPLSISTILKNENLHFKSEYFPVKTFNSNKKIPSIIEIDVQNSNKSLLFVISVQNKSGKTIEWRAFPINKNLKKLIFFDLANYKSRSLKEINCFFWNQTKQDHKIFSMKLNKIL